MIIGPVKVLEWLAIEITVQDFMNYYRFSLKTVMVHCNNCNILWQKMLTAIGGG